VEAEVMSEWYEAAVEIREAILQQFPNDKERRRYALLQAAATIQAGAVQLDKYALPLKALSDAELLLAEIEKREKAERPA
jgi:hypothetical protein